MKTLFLLCCVALFCYMYLGPIVDVVFNGGRHSMAMREWMEYTTLGNIVVFVGVGSFVFWTLHYILTPFKKKPRR